MTMGIGTGRIWSNRSRRHPAGPARSRRQIQLLDFLRHQTELCRVMVQSTHFPVDQALCGAGG